ncbi:DUF4214 domain-containing protein [Stutzerimonas stutzeri]|uniref:DUF4214 domain-containing protein n=1 Tax=Stutzerimonas stutzeri TaxID=316 RepID=UPI002449EDBB|nr:DUF4214 domain-containing protein [Stutzerimonas stutzeri]MDH0609463.1 DUF4214 domain-containing protein [Stutzerimonas stutzeri]
MATVSDLQQLYIGYFGRAADQAGLSFWVEAINNGGLSLANVRASFVQSTEYTAKYQGLTSEALVAQVYLNVLGRPAEAEGKAFWANAIDTGVITEDQLIEGLLSGLSAADQAIINNKVIVANAYTAQRGADFNASDIGNSALIIAPVNGTVASVSTALNTIATTVPASAAANGPVSVALNAYLEAAKAAEDVAKTVIDPATKLPVVDGDADGSVVAEAKAILATAQSTAFTTAQGKVAAASTITLDAADVASVTAAKLTEATTQAAKAVNDAQAAVDAKAGLNAATTSYVAAKAKYDDATVARTAAIGEYNGEAAKFGSFDNVTALPASANDLITAKGVITGLTIVDVATGNLILDPAYATPTKTAAQVAAANDLLADIKAVLAADKAQIAANTAVDNAATAVTTLDNTNVYDTATNAFTAGPVFNLVTEKTQQTELSKAISELNAANAALKQLTDLETAVTNADAAVDKVLAGGLVIANGSAVGDATKAELFIAKANDSVIFEKGDFLYVGAGFVKGVDTDTVKAGIQGGNDSALEVFFQTNGTGNTDVVIEKTAFGSSAATPEVITITLTGVTPDKLAFDADTGLVSVA